MKTELKFVCLTSALIFFAIIQEGFSIKCWDCRSDIDPKCADPFDNTTLSMTDCSQLNPLDHLPNVKSTMCRKLRQKVNGKWKYIRKCAYIGQPGLGEDNDERFCLMRTGTYNIFMEYCTCMTKDGCNSSSFLQLSKILILFGPVFSCILYKVLR